MGRFLSTVVLFTVVVEGQTLETLKVHNKPGQSQKGGGGVICPIPFNPLPQCPLCY
jgi:hypothetical protein